MSTRTGTSLLDAYVQFGQETCGNIGFLRGLWLFRHLVPEQGAAASPRAGSPDEAKAPT